jgi:hypothetical protein
MNPIEDSLAAQFDDAIAAALSRADAYLCATELDLTAEQIRDRLDAAHSRKAPAPRHGNTTVAPGRGRNRLVFLCAFIVVSSGFGSGVYQAYHWYQARVPASQRSAQPTHMSATVLGTAAIASALLLLLTLILAWHIRKRRARNTPRWKALMDEARRARIGRAATEAPLCSRAERVDATLYVLDPNSADSAKPSADDRPDSPRSADGLTQLRPRRRR